jgi:1-acyl-sn-glycerol-3-phosphate acyltransferase
MACGIITNRENTAAFITSRAEQQRRIERWQELVGKHFGILRNELQREAAVAGFSNDAFDDFFQITSRHYKLRSFDYFSTLTNTVFMQNISIDTSQQRYSVVDRVRVKNSHLHDTKKLFSGSFDVKSMNSAIANSLSDDFNYIGIACSAIVFVFLWLSFGRIELAIISFLPMAVSWIWILGLMALFGIKFNIVNVILATFIFGQGDDYTIFMTEGCSHEYAYRKPMLASYKNSIILSALIMFIGIGSLIVAKHPALLSLAEVTIIGMFSVVLMAYLIPPFLFNWITKSGGQYRKRPLTLGALARAWFCGIWWLTQLCIGYLIGFVLFTFFGKREWTRNLLHRIATASHRLDLRLFPGLKNKIINRHNETFEKPCVIICNHQSMIDPAYLMALSPRIIIVANKHSSWNPIVRRMFGWLDFYTVIEDQFEDDLPLFERYVKEGYSIAIYAEGERNPDSTVLRFHKGAFMLASRLNLDILPIYLHGLNNAMPPRSFAINPSTATVIVGERITSASPLWGEDYQETTRRIHRHFLTEYNRIKRNLETTSYFLPLVKERYLYKGREVYAEACRALSKENLAGIDNAGDSPTMIIKNSGCGALALMAALVHPDKTIYAIEEDKDKKLLAQYCAKGLVKNVCFSEK